ncbi:MAG: threonine synthase [Desulfuromonadia bacterium]
MRYLSTRGGITPVTFSQAVMMGLADDGGLLLPERIPTLSPSELADLAPLDYPELAFRIISLFCDDIPASDLREIITRSYRTFDTPLVTPLVEVDRFLVLELFHGPTLAFKDVALQFLGNLFEYLLKREGKHLNIIGATSGDTGSAAIHGVRGKENIAIFILHPHQRTSPVQALQMTTVLDDNVHNIAVTGTFDDCQGIVKGLFGDLEFKEKYRLGAVNSINWARILAQIVYYFSAWFQCRCRGIDRPVVFSVPTGNFGDIFAGYIARRMGIPCGPLILGTNENNILTRLVTQGDYSIGDVVPTISPSMDIQVASNLERYLYYLFDNDPTRLIHRMTRFQETGRMPITLDERERIAGDFRSASVGRQETIATIRRIHADTGYLLDPHTAVGVAAAARCAPAETTPVCLATAHPAKFGEAVEEAIGSPLTLPPSIVDLMNRPTKCDILPPDREKIREYVMKHAIG